jgi:dienelactone hydrolase
MRCSLFTAVVLATVSLAAAEVRRIPPPGVAIPEAERAELQAGVEALGKEIDALRKELASKPELLALLPDVQIFHKSVDWALRYDEFMDVKEVLKAKALLTVGMERAKALHAGEAPWNAQTGLVVRGYRSNIDGSVQPYGLLIPDDFKPGEKTPRRLDFWCHGRGEKLTELAFIDGSMHSKGEFASGFTTPGIVCFLYGRFCNANKFAGERDLFEALDDIKHHYNIDTQRLVIRGFSMGGAACWQFATHHSGMWAAAAPGAGFAETAEFFKVFAEGKTPPPWWEQVLWRWYDCTTMAANLANTSVVAYSGEIDGQKQAADIMVKYAKQEGIEFPHIIGPQTAHKYHPESKPKIEELVTKAAEKKRQPMPQEVRFTTYSLLYPKPSGYFQLTRLEHHWERADFAVKTVGETVHITTGNVARFSQELWMGPRAVVDGQELDIPDGGKLRADSFGFDFKKTAGRWSVGSLSGFDREPALAKNPLTCGPIDHAFMWSFIMVRPTGKSFNEKVGAWTQAEMEHATEFWRRVFRGEPKIADDRTFTGTVYDHNHNWILWGDPSSNAVLKRVIEKLPVKWDAQTLEFNGVKYDPAHHVPILIFPNPLNPNRYIVLNSGPTFREEALLNNSDQTPKLPDWAIVNIDTPPDGKWPGQIIDAGFFDEQWALPKN